MEGGTVRTQRTRGLTVPIIFFLCLLTLISTSDVHARGIVFDCAPTEVDPAHPEDCPFAWTSELLLYFSNADSAELTLDFPLKVADSPATSIVINRNGFLSFQPLEFDPSITALTDLGANVIAPFYAPIEPTDDEVTVGIGQHYDLPVNPGDPVTPFGPAAAYRITWGSVHGVSMLGGPPDITDKFQAIIIDRSDIAEGDFDLQMNYGPINWESPPVPPALTGTATLAGLVVGETIIDFNRYYDSFLSNGLCDEPGKITTPASFSLSEPFVCNNITVEFRDGVGTLVGFTSDLALTAAANTDTINAGEEVELTFTVDNSGPDDTSNTNLVVGLPSGTTLIDTQPEVGTCSSDGAQLTCELGAIAASTSAAVAVSVRAESAGELEFPSAVAADQLDPSASNNAATLSVSVAPSADLNLAASLAPATVNVGDATDLSLTLRNDGPSDASNVHLVATLPTGTSLDDSANLAACTETPTGLDCDLGALPAGTQTALVVPLRADDSGDFSLVVTTEADEHDPDVVDNQAQAVLESHAVSDIALALSSPAQSITQGDMVDLTLTVTNAGPQDASAVTIEVSLPGVVEFSSGDTCAPSGGGIICTQGDLAEGASATIQVVLTASSAGSGSISAEASAAEDDPAPDNNAQALDLSVTASDSGGGGGGGAVDPYALGALLLFAFYRAIGRRGVRTVPGAVP